MEKLIKTHYEYVDTYCTVEDLIKQLIVFKDQGFDMIYCENLCVAKEILETDEEYHDRLKEIQRREEEKQKLLKEKQEQKKTSKVKNKLNKINKEIYKLELQLTSLTIDNFHNITTNSNEEQLKKKLEGLYCWKNSVLSKNTGVHYES